MPLRVEHYTAKRIDNPYPSGDLPWVVYQTVRNAAVRACRRHGPTGPLGECPVHKSFQTFVDLVKAWQAGDKDYVFHVLDDQYNHERYIYLEISKFEYFTERLLEGLARCLVPFPGWGIGINGLNQGDTLKGYVLVFADRLMVTGRVFKNCFDVPSIITAAERNLKPNPLYSTRPTVPKANSRRVAGSGTGYCQ